LVSKSLAREATAKGGCYSSMATPTWVVPHAAMRVASGG